jgi:hypothetical protein
MKIPSIGELEKVMEHIRAAGCVPNHRYYKALRAARALERVLDSPPPEGSSWRVLAANGRAFSVFVPKGSSVLQEAMEQNIEVISFEKA